jgi:beta-galactosidase/beta-glucuronidase
LAGIHRETLLYTTPPAVYVQDLTTATTLANTDAILATEVTVVGGTSATLTLLDASGVVVATNTSALQSNSTTILLVVKSANLWWPWTMSATGGYLYTLVVQGRHAHVPLDIHCT